MEDELLAEQPVAGQDDDDIVILDLGYPLGIQLVQVQVRHRGTGKDGVVGCGSHKERQDKAMTLKLYRGKRHSRKLMSESLMNAIDFPRTSSRNLRALTFSRLHPPGFPLYLRKSESGLPNMKQVQLESPMSEHLQVVKPFLEPKTYNKVKFVYSADLASQKIMEDLFEIDQLEPAFGGKGMNCFDISKYTERMKEDDRKVPSFWERLNSLLPAISTVTASLDSVALSTFDSSDSEKKEDLVCSETQQVEVPISTTNHPKI